MHVRPTHFGALGTRYIYQGGVTASGTLGWKGGQPLQPARNPSNWYAANLPAAPSGTPTDAQCKQLCANLAQFVAEETIRQSVMLPINFLAVQTGVTIPAASVTGTLGNGTTGVGAMVANATYNGFGESVPVDVVLKYPGLMYDLGVRLAAQLAGFLDSKLLSLSGSFTTVAQGTSGTPITRAVVASSIAQVASTGEPLFLVASPAAFGSMTSNGAYPALPTFPELFADVDFNPQCFEFPNQIGVLGGAQQLVRLMCSAAVPAGPPIANQLITPSTIGLITFDLGTNLSMLTGVVPPALPGTNQFATGVSRDPETGVAELCVQVCMGNTGAGNQTVWVNAGYAPVLANPARGCLVKG